MKYKDCESAREYLEFVLKHWKTWQTHNGGIYQAISEILDENIRLKAKLYELEHGNKK